MLRQSEIYSQIYHFLVQLLAARQGSAQAIPHGACEAIARIAIVPTTHFFFDRALRLAHLVDSEPGLELPRTKSSESPTTIEDFYEVAAASGAFNQAILAYLAPCWSLSTAARVDIAESAEAPSSNPPGYINYLFHFPDRGLWKRIAGRALQEWSSISGTVGAASMVNVRVPLLEKGLYGRKLLAHVPYPVPFEDGTRNLSLRRSIVHDALSPAEEQLIRLVRQLGWPAQAPLDTVVRKYFNFLCNFLPTSLLESAPKNVARACGIFERFRGRAVISGGMGFSTQTAFLVAACRILEIPLIGMQHGGHYGYSDQHVSVYECEYPLCDGFITWGWTQMPRLPDQKAPKAYALPAPWLSERIAYWDRFLPTRDRFAKDRSYDILFMPNKISRFPPAPSGSHATVNHLTGFAKTTKSLLERAERLGLKVLHKPFNRATKELLFDAMHPYSRPDHEYHQFASENEKGLTPALLKLCHLVVWDQPGTGFLECLSAGIPNLVLWTRLFNSEPEWARESFASLERVGIVHTEVDSLLHEIMKYKRDPAAWFGNDQRQAAAQDFCRRYAWTDPNWADAWRKFLAELQL